MNTYVGRNDLCPCGSRKKYKKCCLGKKDNPEYSDVNNFAEIYKRTRKESRIKECIHPDKKHCSERVIGAHSIQNNRILAKISDNGFESRHFDSRKAHKITSTGFSNAVFGAVYSKRRSSRVITFVKTPLYSFLFNP